MLDIILALVFPILLFIFKYILPSLAKAAYKKTKRENGQIKIELIHFPVDLLFIAIGYTIPKIIYIESSMSNVIMENSSNFDLYNELLLKLSENFILSILIMGLIPFCVFGTEIAEKWYFSKKQKMLLSLLIPIYIFSIFLIFLSITI